MSRRDEQREYEGDVFYEAYRRGINTDRIDYDRLEQAFDDGRSVSYIPNQIQQQDANRRYEQDMENARYEEDMRLAQEAYEQQAEE